MVIYALISDKSVEQGDIFNDVVCIQAGDIFKECIIDGNGGMEYIIDESEETKINWGITGKAILLTNTCDLPEEEDGDKRVNHVIFAPIMEIEELAVELEKGKSKKILKRIRKKLKDNEYSRYLTLPQSTGEGSLSFGRMVIDLRRIFTIDWDFFMLINEKQKFKIRLLSPNKEKLGSEIGFFFSRVAVDVR